MFIDRRDAGKQICRLLEKYKNSDCVVYALPRGGVVVADEIANFLKAPLDLILAHKIGHPYHSEYAVAAVSENGTIVGNTEELASLGNAWLKKEKARQLEEIAKKRKMYLQDQPEIPVKGKIAIIVDDGIATGLTMLAGLKELKERNPKRLVVAVPVSPKETADLMLTIADDFIAPLTPNTGHFFGSVGAYYANFDQVEDEEVIAILNKHRKAINGLDNKTNPEREFT